MDQTAKTAVKIMKYVHVYTCYKTQARREGLGGVGPIVCSCLCFSAEQHISYSYSTKRSVLQVRVATYYNM